MSPKRHQTQTERDFEGLAARKEREAAPVHVDEEYTGRYEGDELAQKRATRPTDQRISRLEVRYDDFGNRLSRMESKLDTAVDFIKVKVAEDAKTQRTKITTQGKVLIAIICAAITTVGTVVVAVLR